MDDYISRQEVIALIKRKLKDILRNPDGTLSRMNTEYAGGLYRAKRLIEDVPSASPLSEVDLIELEDRFGENVRYVVEDMISGRNERWKE